MKIYGVSIPEDDIEFLRTYAEIIWYEERFMNIVTIAVNRGVWGKGK